MSVVTYDAGQMLLTIDDTGVERALGSLYRKTPAVLKVAINRTARQARKDLIEEAEKRYALTVRGKARLRLLKLRKSATNTSLSAELRQGDEGLTLNASYFEHYPTRPRMGKAALTGPSIQGVRVLKGKAMEPLTAGPMKVKKAVVDASKGFFIKVSNSAVNPDAEDHLMFAARLIGSSTDASETKTGKPRWRNRAGNVEKAYDVNRIGASSQQRAVWYRGVDTTAAENLEWFVEQRIREVIAAAK